MTRPAISLALVCAVACDPQTQGSRQASSAATGPAAGSGLGLLVAAADSVYRTADFVEAKRRFAIVLDSARRAADRRVEAHALTWLGLAAYRLQEYGDARRLGEEALALKIRHGLRADVFRSYNALVLLAQAEGRHFDALALYRRAVDTAADTASLARAWSNAALSLTELGEYTEARTLFIRALSGARSVGDRLVEGRVLSNLGMLEVRVGDPTAALQYLEAARVLLRQTGDQTGEQNLLGQVGTAYAALGEPGRAIASLDTAVRLSRKLGNRQELVTSLVQIAELYRGAGELRRALQLLQEAMAIERELGMKQELGTDLRRVADVHSALGNAKLADRSMDEALRVHRELAVRLEVLADLLMLAEQRHRAGKADDAARHLAEARRLARELDAPAPRAAVAMTAARIADAAGRSGEVLRVLEAARPFLAAGGLDREWEMHLLTARAHARSGRLEAAAAAGNRSVASVERIRGEYGSATLRTSYLADREAAYIELVDYLLRLGRTEEALEVSDGARGRALQEHLATRRLGDATVATARELAEEERQIVRHVETLLLRADEARSQRGPEADYRAQVESLSSLVQTARGKYAEALLRTQEGRPAKRALSGGARARAGSVRSALRPSEVLVEYLVAPDVVYTFAVTRDTVIAFRRDVVRGELGTRARVARELVARRSARSASSRPALEALGETLLGEISRSGMLRGRSTLIVVPHAELSYVPFPALVMPGTGRYLVEDYVVAALPSAAALAGLRERRAVDAPAESRAAFAPVPENLPASVAEITAVRAAMRRVRVASGRRATEAAVRRALATDDVVHVATHGLLNVGSPIFSSLAMARGSGAAGDDGRLELHEVIGIPVRSRLVFLSGCETGAGLTAMTQFDRGEDYATLSRAFLYAGASAVVATLWRVDDLGASVFAGHFYERLADMSPKSGQRSARELDPAVALAAAQRKMMVDHRYRAPYYWAGYVLSGDAAPIHQ